MTTMCDLRTPLFPDDFEGEARLFQAMADKYRLKILATIARNPGKVCLCDFTYGLPLEQSTVSHHVQMLREAGLIVPKRRGKWVYYSLAPDLSASVRRTLNAIVRPTTNARVAA